MLNLQHSLIGSVDDVPAVLRESLTRAVKVGLLDADVVGVPGGHGKDGYRVCGEALAELEQDAYEVELHWASDAKRSPWAVDPKPVSLGFWSGRA